MCTPTIFQPLKTKHGLDSQAHISELALQRSLELYGELGEVVMVERVFAAYHNRRQALNEDYSPEKITRQIYKRAIESTLP